MDSGVALEMDSTSSLYELRVSLSLLFSCLFLMRGCAALLRCCAAALLSLSLSLAFFFLVWVLRFACGFFFFFFFSAMLLLLFRLSCFFYTYIRLLRTPFHIPAHATHATTLPGLSLALSEGPVCTTYRPAWRSKDWTVPR